MKQRKKMKTFPYKSLILAQTKKRTKNIDNKKKVQKYRNYMSVHVSTNLFLLFTLNIFV